MAVACSSTRTLADAASRSRYRRPRCVSGHQTVNRCRKRRGSNAGRSTPKRVPHALVVGLAVDLKESLRTADIRLQLGQVGGASRCGAPTAASPARSGRAAGTGRPTAPSTRRGAGPRPSVREAGIDAARLAAAEAVTPGCFGSSRRSRAGAPECTAPKNSRAIAIPAAPLPITHRSVTSSDPLSEPSEIFYHQAPFGRCYVMRTGRAASNRARGPVAAGLRLRAADGPAGEAGVGPPAGRRPRERGSRISIPRARTGTGRRRARLGSSFPDTARGVTVATKLGMVPPRRSRALGAAKTVARAAARHAPAARAGAATRREHDDRSRAASIRPEARAQPGDKPARARGGYGRPPAAARGPGPRTWRPRGCTSSWSTGVREGKVRYFGIADRSASPLG